MPREAAPLNKHFLHAERLAYGGDAVGFLDSGKVCFVPGLLPGEDAEIIITQEKKSFARGAAVKIISAAPERIVPECPYFPECPGCAYIHCDYQTELKWKQQQFADFLQRSDLIGNGELLPPFGAPLRCGYRNKLKLHRSGNGFAMIGRDNRSLIKIDRCILADPGINRALKEYTASNDSEVVTFRRTEADGVVAFSGVRAGKQNRYLTETIPGAGEFKVSADGFFQTNIAVAAELVRRAVAGIKDSGFKTLVELYCGVGIFSIAAANQIPGLRCTGIELNPEAIKAAKLNAASHNLADRCRFFAGDAGKLLKKSDIGPESCLLLDPPRSGLAREALDNIIAADPGRIIYISCAADTLQRDLQIFKKHNWQIAGAGILDMFPGTAHFEAMVTLIKR